MRRSLYIFFCLALVGCTMEELPEVSLQSDKQVTFTVRNDFRVETRAIGDCDSIKSTLDGVFYVDSQPYDETLTRAAVDDLSKFYVNVYSGTASKLEYSNKEFNKSNGVFTGGIYWPETNPQYKFFASNVQLKTGVDYTKIECHEGIDVVCASLTSPSFGTTNAFSFKHVYGRVGTLSMATMEGYTVTFVSAKIKASKTGTYDLSTGAWSTKASQGDISLSATNDLYVVPGTYEVTVTAEVSDGSTAKVITRSGSVEILGNKVNNITAYVTDDDKFTYELAVASNSDDYLLVGETRGYTATYKTLLRGKEINSVDVTSSAEWNVDNGTIASVSKGEVTCLDGGKVKVWAKYGGKESTRKEIKVGKMVFSLNKYINEGGQFLDVPEIYYNEVLFIQITCGDAAEDFLYGIGNVKHQVKGLSAARRFNDDGYAKYLTPNMSERFAAVIPDGYKGYANGKYYVNGVLGQRYVVKIEPDELDLEKPKDIKPGFSVFYNDTELEEGDKPEYKSNGNCYEFDIGGEKYGWIYNHRGKEKKLAAGEEYTGEISPGDTYTLFYEGKVLKSDRKMEEKIFNGTKTVPGV